MQFKINLKEIGLLFFRLNEVLTEKRITENLLKQLVNTSINRKNMKFIFFSFF